MGVADGASVGEGVGAAVAEGASVAGAGVAVVTDGAAVADADPPHPASATAPIKVRTAPARRVEWKVVKASPS